MTQVMIAVMVAAGLSYGARAGRVEKMADARVEEFLDEVGARPEQRVKVKGLEAQLKTELVPLLKEGAGNRRELAEQWKASSVDRIKVHAIVDRQLKGLEQFAHKAADLFISLHDVLTPEQREKASELRQQQRQARISMMSFE